MSKIYVGQDWTLTLETCVTLTGYTTLEIWALKPGETTPLKKSGTVVDTTKVQAEFSASDTDGAGSWRFQAYLVHTGKTRYGETYKMEVYEEFL